jgi:hypothetical protein
MAQSDDQAWLAAVRASLANELNKLWPEWTIEGPVVKRKGTLAVHPVVTHGDYRNHVDIGFYLNRDRADAPVLWDCVAGPGNDLRAAADFAASAWAQSTAPPILELLHGDGRFAEHSNGDDGIGLPGWHGILGPLLGYGSDSAEPLQTWCLKNPLIPALQAYLAPRLADGLVHGVKFLLGAMDPGIAEVRINGQRDDAASEALFRLPWPRGRRSVLRSYAVFVHPHPPGQG